MVIKNLMEGPIFIYVKIVYMYELILNTNQLDLSGYLAHFFYIPFTLPLFSLPPSLKILH